MSAAEPTPEAPPSEPTGTPETPPTPAPDTPPAPSFHDMIDSDLRNHEVVKRYGTATDMAKALIEQRQALSKKGFIRPGKDATAEQVRQSMTEWGVPENPSPEAYGIGEAPEGVTYEPEVVQAALEIMHHVGLVPEQAKPLFEWFNQLAQKGDTDARQRTEELGLQWGRERQERWGTAHDSKFDVATRAIRYAFPDQGFLSELSNAKLPGGGIVGDHVEFWEGMSRLAEAVPQEHQLLGDKEPTRYSRTPEDARNEITQMKADPSFRAIMLKERGNMTPEEKDRLARYQDLFKMAYPGVQED